MNNIHYKGKLDKAKMMETSKLPQHATKLIPDTSQMSETKRAYVLSLPVLIPLLGFGIIKFFTLQGGRLIDLIFFDCIGIIVLFLLYILHEFIHAMFYPKEAEKQIWYEAGDGHYNLIMYCNESLSKKRFILMALAPNIILGLVPYLIWMSGIFDGDVVISKVVGLVCMLMISGGIWDFTNVYDVLKNVPANASILAYGEDNYIIHDTSTSNAIEAAVCVEEVKEENKEKELKESDDEA